MPICVTGLSLLGPPWGVQGQEDKFVGTNTGQLACVVASLHTYGALLIVQDPHQPSLPFTSTVCCGPLRPVACHFFCLAFLSLHCHPLSHAWPEAHGEGS